MLAAVRSNKVIVSSLYLLRVMQYLKTKVTDEFIIATAKKDNNISFSGTDMKINCYCLNDFEVPLYKSTIERLIKLLSLLDEQPITISFKDNELFNVSIHEAVVAANGLGL